MARQDVLLLPGMMLDARLFAGQIAGLSARAQVAVPDLGPGDTIGAIAEQLLSAAPARFALVGLSMGGIVALELWRRVPDRITHLGLLDTTPYADTEQRRAGRLEQMAAVESGRLREVVLESMLPLYLAARNRTDRRLLRSIVEQALTLGPEAFRRQSLALRDRCDSFATLPTIDRPSLVLCGREDQLCPLDHHVAMAKAMPTADLVVLANCGHLSPMEDPVAVNGAIERLLARSA